MKTIAQQVKDLENTRAAKAARMEAIAQKSIDEGRSMDDAETEEFDTIEGEIKSLDDDLVRLSKLDKLMQSAKPVEQPKEDENPRKSASEQRHTGPTIIVKKDQDEKFKGQNFTRIVIAKTLAFIDQTSPVVIAQKRWGKTNPTLVEVIKAAVAGGGTDTGEWGAELSAADSRFTGDFVEYLHEMTVFDRLGLREVPENIVIKGQDGAATGYWVGESKPIPVSKLDFFDVELKFKKVAALAVVSKELLRTSTPAAEALVREALAKASAQRVDLTFLSTSAVSTGVSPAGILNGVTPIASAGTDGDGVVTDIGALKAAFIAALNAGDLSFVMNSSLASAIGLLRNALGQWEFPDINEMGGTLVRTPVVTGDNVNPAHMILLKPSDIWKIGDRGIEVSVSTDATIEQDSEPTGATDTPVAQTVNQTSMFQTESVAIKVVRPIDFAKRRASAVAYINDAAYGAVSS